MAYEKFKITSKEPTKIYKILMQNGYTMPQAQRIIDKGRVQSFAGNTITEKNQIASEIYLIDYKCYPREILPIFDNQYFAVFDKPSGVLSHPNGRHCKYSLYDEIWNLYDKNACVAHRLDRETSGVILVSKNAKAQNLLKTMFEKKLVKKSYYALVQGRVDEKFEVNAKIGSSFENDDVKVRMRIRDDGKTAITRFELVEYFDEFDASLLKCIPLTGRQHQIRLHMFHVKHRIIGDPLYGVSKETVETIMDERISPIDRVKQTSASRLCLHASELEFEFLGEKFCIKTKMDYRDEFLKSLSV
ncbi:MAG: RluA family pseudouridine synthase [Campylobacter sp.]|nr:RluA family pseudouridine synthase [Campylobacter sp.]